MRNNFIYTLRPNNNEEIRDERNKAIRKIKMLYEIEKI